MRQRLSAAWSSVEKKVRQRLSAIRSSVREFADCVLSRDAQVGRENLSFLKSVFVLRSDLISCPSSPFSLLHLPSAFLSWRGLSFHDGCLSLPGMA